MVAILLSICDPRSKSSNPPSTPYYSANFYILSAKLARTAYPRTASFPDSHASSLSLKANASYSYGCTRTSTPTLKALGRTQQHLHFHYSLTRKPLLLRLTPVPGTPDVRAWAGTKHRPGLLDMPRAPKSFSPTLFCLLSPIRSSPLAVRQLSGMAEVAHP